MVPVGLYILDTCIAIPIEEAEELFDSNYSISYQIHNGTIFISAIDFLESSNILYREIDGIKEVYALRRILTPGRSIHQRYSLPNLTEVILEASNFI
jgi:hypothetical protein